MSVSDDDRDLLLEQVRYYDARASEYDDWFNRRGRYDRGEEATRAWFNEISDVRAILEKLPLDGGDLLELAPGTGIWTELLAPRAASLTAVDASLEMTAIAQERLAPWRGQITFVHEDLFSWEPRATFDAVVFCFWISHVPSARLEEFVAKVARALKPGGVVFFVDSRRDPRSTALNHELPKPGVQQMIRRLDDGREFSIIKNFWDPAILVEHFAHHGISLAVTETPIYFSVGVGWRSES